MSFDTARISEEAERLNEELRKEGWIFSEPRRIYEILVFGRDYGLVDGCELTKRDARGPTYAAAVLNKCRRPAMVPA